MGINWGFVRQSRRRGLMDKLHGSGCQLCRDCNNAASGHVNDLSTTIYRANSVFSSRSTGNLFEQDTFLV